MSSFYVSAASRLFEPSHSRDNLRPVNIHTLVPERRDKSVNLRNRRITISHSKIIQKRLGDRVILIEGTNQVFIYRCSSH
jgi:hypothetical protein